MKIKRMLGLLIYALFLPVLVGWGDDDAVSIRKD